MPLMDNFNYMAALLWFSIFQTQLLRYLRSKFHDASHEFYDHFRR